MKTCTKCGVSKEETEFHKAAREKSGRRSNCKTCAASDKKEYRLQNLEKIRELAREYAHNKYWENPDFSRAQAREKYANNPESALLAGAKWLLKNPEYHCGYQSTRYREDPVYRVGKILRARQTEEIRLAKATKSGSSMTLTGCSEAECWAYLESLFKPGMAPENQGIIWEIDHIKPCAAFDLRDPEQQKACFHWTNLQPLFKEENRQKSDKFPLTK